MASSQRVLTLLEKPLFNQVMQMAERDGISLSQKIRDLVREAAERDEDADLLMLVSKRKDSGEKLIHHSVFWNLRGKQRKKRGSR